jgi:hypothetical protein
VSIILYWPKEIIRIFSKWFIPNVAKPQWYNEHYRSSKTALRVSARVFWSKGFIKKVLIPMTRAFSSSRTELCPVQIMTGRSGRIRIASLASDRNTCGAKRMYLKFLVSL